MSRPSTSSFSRRFKTWMPGQAPGMTNERLIGTTMNQPASAYFLEDRHDPNETHTLSVLVQNEPGVLARVIGLFSGRGYNIESLTVSETESQKHLSRITIVTTGTPMVIEQIKHQLDRMVPVYRVVDMTITGRSIERELAMVKVCGGGDNRVEALRLADAFRARVIDATTESFVFEITGNSSKINQFIDLRRQLGLDSAVASIYDRHDDSDLRARAALTMLGVQKGWRMADIGCGNGVLACEAALLGAEVDAIDISPAMLALANIQARDRKVAIRTQPAGMLSFAYQPNSYDLIVSEFTLHHLPDFWKAVALARIYAALKPGANFYLRDIVFVSTPDGTERDVEQWADFTIKNHDFQREGVVTHMRDEYSTFGWVIERMLTDAGFTLESVDYHAPLHGTYLLRKPKPDQQS